MDLTPAQRDLADLDAQREQLGKEYRRICDELGAVRDLRDGAVDARLAELTDDEIMGDEPTLRWVLRESFSHSGASKRVKTLSKIDVPGVSIGGIDGRDEYADQVLPNLHLMLLKDQEIGAVAEAVRRWSKVWALGRADLYVGITERTLSERGSFSIMYDPATDNAHLTRLTYGHRTSLEDGPLDAVLRVVARDVWYERSDGGNGYYEDEDED
jgi:hypothetical protein